MKKLFIYILIVGLVGCIFSITMQDTGTTVINTMGVGVAHADTLSDPHPTPPPPIPK